MIRAGITTDLFDHSNDVLSLEKNTSKSVSTGGKKLMSKTHLNIRITVCIFSFLIFLWLQACVCSFFRTQLNFTSFSTSERENSL